MTLSPAERYAAAKQRRSSPLTGEFAASRPHELDPFQRAGCLALERGSSVLVAAPTGAGKTTVAEFAIFAAMRTAREKVFYTAPMKALSNQKYRELAAEYGPDAVGLLTGDSNVNSGARIVVMTTEVLRNMLYAGSALLTDLAFVVLDEVHYLADRFRGAVWEEVILHLPRSVRTVSLSATVSNAEEFGDWLQTVRGDTEVIVSEERPVPLEQHVLLRSSLLELFSSGARGDRADGGAPVVNPELVRLSRGTGPRRGPRRGPDRAEHRMSRAEVVRMLHERTLLPAIVFVFSRAGCDAAVQQVLASGLALTDRGQREQIRGIAEERCRGIPDADLGALDYFGWLDGLERGVAAHHAGLIPVFKEVVEELFQRRLVTVVFATETLALGVNMPARTVVLERLEKFNGEARVPITPGEYTQLTGRAGRRGIDVEGHSVIQWSAGLDPQAVASLASRRSYPLNSSFRPTYNMAVNLIAQFGRERSAEILESSFAQFQADRAVVELAQRARRQQDSLAGYAEAMRCHLGDFAEYSGMRRELSELERAGTGRAGVESRGERERRQRRLAGLRGRLRQHPCHACAEREAHARWAERYWRLRRETDALTASIRGRTAAVATTFDRVNDVLLRLGHLEAGRAEGGPAELRPTELRPTELRVAEPGRLLRRIYGERDLLVAEALRAGLWDRLTAPQLAAMTAALVYEPRRGEGREERLPTAGAFRDALLATERLWARLDELEEDAGLPRSQPLAAGISQAMHRWAGGGRLDVVLREAELAAGDFVRWSRQCIDLLDQLSIVADPPVGVTARRALESLRRGIVAHSVAS
ncbi:MAG: DEAD/DEAH box helicase [Microbacteriaceae bacterium]